MGKKSCIFLMGLLLVLSACGKPGETPAPTTALEEYQTPAPVFLSYEAGLAAIEPLVFGSIGWQLDAQGEYVFAKFGRYIVRYDAAANQIDKFIDLGEAPEGSYHASTFSPDGRLCVAQAWNFPDHDAYTDKVLIDLADETFRPTEQEFYPHGYDKGCRVELFVAPGVMRYDFHFSDESVKEITALQPYADSLAEAIVIDEARIGAVLPDFPTHENGGLLGYYKFAVIDVEQDIIVQTCPMNILQTDRLDTEGSAP